MTDRELLGMFEGMFSDGYGDVSHYTCKVVTTRLPTKCPGNFKEALHDVPKGTRGIREKAILDKKWATFFTCEECIVKYAMR
jgi:hypothetical protein